MNTIREDFEAWAEQHGFDLSKDRHGNYLFVAAHAWQAWHAARQPVGEAVAVVGEDGYPQWLASFLSGTKWADTVKPGTKLYAAPPQQPERVEGYVMVQVADAKALCAYVTHSPRSALAARRVAALINQQESKQ